MTPVSGEGAETANTSAEQQNLQGGSFHLISSISNCFSSHSTSALELLKNAIAKAGYTDKIVIGMDVAASEFYKAGKYDLDFKSADDPSRYITPDQLADLYRSFVKDYPGAFSPLFFIFFFPSCPLHHTRKSASSKSAHS